ncbi:MAG: hypothetical protein QOE36_591 [Gaiellaceae bacterium]|nr:hypothetical protein [Gaiellaceae bacterium]
MSDPQASPSIGFVTDWSIEQGLTYAEERLAFAQQTHARLRPMLEQLRAVPLSFVEPVIEPASGAAWLENGGRS